MYAQTQSRQVRLRVQQLCQVQQQQVSTDLNTYYCSTSATNKFKIKQGDNVVLPCFHAARVPAVI